MNHDERLVLAIVAALALLLVAALSSARAQENHAKGHNDYEGWSSQSTGNCCNNQDCGELKEEEWRENENGTEILIKGEWCPVKKEHFIITGKSPDATHAHACIQYKNYKPTCEQLLCFVGPAKS